MLNDAIRYVDGVLRCEDIPLADLAPECGTPAYIYSQSRLLANYQRIADAFANINTHIHYSIKANANITVMQTLIHAGAGIDCVSGGEVYLALQAGCNPKHIVFAGVGKTYDELRFTIKKGIGWINVENVAEVDYIDTITAELGKSPTRVALRLNPGVTANTHPYIATGHGGAKFGLTADAINAILSRQQDYPHINFAGIHVHIGSQLHDTEATAQAIRAAINLIKPYPNIRTIDIGGGLPVAYAPDETLPDLADFADAIEPLVAGYEVILEPGRSIVADAGVLLAKVLYVKRQAGQIFYIVDASIAELIRPALYQAQHEIIPVIATSKETNTANVVGQVCETADVLGRDLQLPELAPGDLVAILTAGAYGMVMASNYNARPRPPEILVNGDKWLVIREREKLADLL